MGDGKVVGAIDIPEGITLMQLPPYGSMSLALMVLVIGQIQNQMVPFLSP